MGGNRNSPDEGLGPLQRPLAELCCVNPECSDNGRRGHGNLLVRTGKGGGRWRILSCRTCKTEFSERKGTPLFGTKLPPEKFEAVAAHLQEGCGIRKTSRLTGVSKDGVTSVAVRTGLHARAQHDERVRDLKVREAQFDEKWAFVEKKQALCDPSDPADASKGDQWDHTAIDVRSRMVVSLVVGKRDGEALREVINDFADRTGGAPPP
jgi:transposase-like protein